VLTLLAGVSLSTCGSVAPAASPQPSGPVPTVTVPMDLPVVITLVGELRPLEIALLDEQIALFEAANPDIRVEIAELRRSGRPALDVLGSRLAQGDVDMDVLLLDDAWLTEFASLGGLTPLDEAVDSHGVDMSSFLPPSVQASTVDGTLFALPWLADAGLLYYRRDLLEELGLPLPNTWPDLERLALALKEETNLPCGYAWQGAANENLTCNTLEFVWARGGDLLDKSGNVIFDSPQTLAALQQMTDLVISGASPGDIATYGAGKTLATFGRGDSGLMRNWFYAWDRLQGDESVVRGQVGTAALPTSCLLSLNLALSVHSMYPDKAFRLMRFLVGYDQQLQIGRQLDRAPALETVYANAQLLRERPFFEELHDAIIQARPRPRTVAYPEVSEVIYTEVNRMLAGEQSPQETAAVVQRRIEALLEEQ
jgi:multiple sugar transport system substrate-binding protein